MDSMSEAQEPRRPRLSLLPALIGATVLLAVGYWFVKDAPKSPGDWLVLLRNEDLSARYSPPGFGFAWLVDVGKLWSRDPHWLLLFGFLSCLVGVGLLARRIARTEGVSDNILVVSVAALAVLPWVWPSPNALTGLGRFATLLVLGLAAWAQRLGWKRSLPVLVVLGGLAGSASGSHLAYGAAILLAALVPRRAWVELVPVLGFVAAAWATKFAQAAHTLPGPQTWWVDAGLSGPFDADLGQPLLAAVGLGVGFAGISGVRRAALPWACFTLLAALVIALVDHRVEAQRWKRSIRDEASLNLALAKMPALVPVYFLNVPIHVRPLLAVANPDPVSWSRITLLETWDTGAQLHLPVTWQFPFMSPVCRWTATGFQVLTWRDCLNVPSFPLAVVVGGKPPAFRSPWDMIRAGKLAAGASRAVESYEDSSKSGTTIRLEVAAGPAGRLAIAGLPARSMHLSDRSLTTPLIARWSLPTTSALQVEGAKPLETGERLAGYGPVFAIPPDALKAVFLVPDATKG